ncbi:MAG: NAD(P)-binding domain-containing protein [Phycisphaerales bacterium JB040]
MDDGHVAHSARVGIIGGGPIGLETAWALGRRGVDATVLEAGRVGSTMAWWAPGTRYFSSPERIEICGVPLVTASQDKATREEYLDYLRQVVGARSLDVRPGRRVLRVWREGDGFVVETARSVHGVGGEPELRREADRKQADREHAGTQRWRFERLVLAIGNMHRPRTLAVPGEGLPHVSHYLRDPGEYAGLDVLIVGGKNSAAEAAIRLHRAGARVRMSYRRGMFDRERLKYWIHPELEWLIRKGAIGFEARTEVELIDPAGVVLRGTEFDPEHLGEVLEGAEPVLAPHESRRVAPDRVLLLTGYVQDRGLFDELGVQTWGEEQRPRFDPETMESNVPGVYIAGTAAGGSQRRTKVFIETAHVHAERIAAAVVGEVSRAEAPRYGAMEES